MGLVPHQRGPPGQRRRPCRLARLVDDHDVNLAPGTSTGSSVARSRPSRRSPAGPTLNDASDLFAWQHDPEWLGNGEILDLRRRVGGHGQHRAERDYHRRRHPGRGHQAQLPDRHGHAGQSDPQPEGLSASSQGNAQPLPGGGGFVGWGNCLLLGVRRRGQLLFNAEFPTGVNTYRAYLLPWNPGGRSGLRQVLTGATSATEHSGSGPLLGRAPPVAGWRSAASGPRPAQPLSGVRYCFLL